MKHSILALALLATFGSAFACSGVGCTSVSPTVTGNVTSYSGVSVGSGSNVTGSGVAAHGAAAFAENCTTVSANGVGAVGKAGGLANITTSATTVGASGVLAGGVGNGGASAQAVQWGQADVTATYQYGNQGSFFGKTLPSYDATVESHAGVLTNVTATVVNTGIDGASSVGGATNTSTATGGHALNVAKTGVTSVGLDGVVIIGNSDDNGKSYQYGSAAITVGNSVALGNGNCTSVTSCNNSR